MNVKKAIIPAAGLGTRFLPATKAMPKEIALLLIPLAFMVLQPITEKYKDKILKYYSYSIVLFVVYFLIRAIIRFFILKDTSVFFYHGEYDNDIGLVSKELNAIHVSVFVAIAAVGVGIGWVTQVGTVRAGETINTVDQSLQDNLGGIAPQIRWWWH